MVKVNIDFDEAYPVYYFTVQGATPRKLGADLDVPEPDVVRWLKIEEDYTAYQNELKSLYDSYEREARKA
jgi:hypothetical protein